MGDELLALADPVGVALVVRLRPAVPRGRVVVLRVAGNGPAAVLRIVRGGRRPGLVVALVGGRVVPGPVRGSGAVLRRRRVRRQRLVPVGLVLAGVDLGVGAGRVGRTGLVPGGGPVGRAVVRVVRPVLRNGAVVRASVRPAVPGLVAVASLVVTRHVAVPGLRRIRRRRRVAGGLIEPGPGGVVPPRVPLVRRSADQAARRDHRGGLEDIVVLAKPRSVRPVRPVWPLRPVRGGLRAPVVQVVQAGVGARAATGVAVVGRSVTAAQRVVPVQSFVVGVPGVVTAVEGLALRAIILAPAGPETAHGWSPPGSGRDPATARVTRTRSLPAETEPRRTQPRSHCP